MKREFIAIIAIGAFLASMLLSAELTSGVGAADDGQSGLHPTSVNDYENHMVQKASNYNGMHYDESSLVKGTGDVSIRGSFGDHGMDSSGWLKGNGTINYESQRSVSKKWASVDFNQKSDLVFDGGQLISIKNLESPLFYKGSGASINEWANLNHVNKSEIDIIKSANRFNNTVVFDTELAFDGTWGIENQIGSGFGMKKGQQWYTGSFQTQKNIVFSESGKE